MSNVKRVFVEKKPEFAVAAKELGHEIRHYLGITDVTGVRVLIRYDVENISDETFEKACQGVFAEPPVDILYKETFNMSDADHSFSVEYLPGQFDQRADSAEQCVRFIKEDETPVIHTATTYVIEGTISEEEFAETEERLNVLNHIKNRYGKTLEDVNRALEEKKARLDILSDYDLYLERLKKELRDAEETLQQAAERLTTLRKKAAKELTAKISSHLLDLNFLEVKFEMVFQKFSEFTLSGIDDVEFMIELLTRLSAYGHGAAPSFETIHTTPFLRHAALSFAASISSSNIEFTSHIAPELPDLMGDPTLLKEVLINLLKNAFEAIDPEHKDNISGSIHLKAFMRCGKLHITISDSGCGITPEQIDHIFNPFVSFKKGGSGIGLAIVKRIVNSHMGTLDLTSNIGCGTTFSVILPVKKYGTDKPTYETSDMSHNINPGSCNPIIRCN